MPEAPEVQNVISSLEKELQGRKILHASITHPKLSDNIPYEEMQSKLEGQTFRRFLRHGKYLIFEMDDYDWICHLRMEGKFLVLDTFPEDPKISKHIHARFDLDDGRMLCYYDTRKFGRMHLYEKSEDKHNHKCLKDIGLDVLDPKADGEYLLEKLKKRKIPIKSALLDQSVIAGIGNIYADEILFQAGLDPRSVSSHLDLEDCTRIMNAARDIIQASIQEGGTTIRSFSYGHGQSGNFQNELQVHARDDSPCPKCSGPIEKIKVGQRSTYLCPNCQVLK